jgi:hypothetical protein
MPPRSPEAICMNVPGSFESKCEPGFSGDGTIVNRGGLRLLRPPARHVRARQRARHCGTPPIYDADIPVRVDVCARLPRAAPRRDLPCLPCCLAQVPRPRKRRKQARPTRRWSINPEPHVDHARLVWRLTRAGARARAGRGVAPCPGHTLCVQTSHRVAKYPPPPALASHPDPARAVHSHARPDYARPYVACAGAQCPVMVHLSTSAWWPLAFTPPSATPPPPPPPPAACSRRPTRRRHRRRLRRSGKP